MNYKEVLLQIYNHRVFNKITLSYNNGTVEEPEEIETRLVGSPLNIRRKIIRILLENKDKQFDLKLYADDGTFIGLDQYPEHHLCESCSMLKNSLTRSGLREDENEAISLCPYYKMPEVKSIIGDILSGVIWKDFKNMSIKNYLD